MQEEQAGQTLGDAGTSLASLDKKRVPIEGGYDIFLLPYLRVQFLDEGVKPFRGYFFCRFFLRTHEHSSSWSRLDSLL